MVFMEGGDSLIGRFLAAMQVTNSAFEPFIKGWEGAKRAVLGFFGVLTKVVGALGELIGQMAAFIYLTTLIDPLAERTEAGVKRHREFLTQEGLHPLSDEAMTSKRTHSPIHILEFIVYLPLLWSAKYVIQIAIRRYYMHSRPMRQAFGVAVA